MDIEEEVIESWLRHELKKRGKNYSSTDTEEPLEKLYSFKKESKAVFESVEGWKLEKISAEKLGKTLVFPSKRWRKFASEKGGKRPTVMKAAERIRYGEEVEEDIRKAVDIRKIKEMEEDIGDGEDIRIVLAYYRDERIPSIFDGNHRAVALALKSLRGEKLPNIKAFIGQNEGNGIVDWDCKKCVPAEEAGKL